MSVQALGGMPTGETVAKNKSDVLQGTLDLMVLKTLESMGPLHGYGIARRIEQVSEHSLLVNQGTIYPALLRLDNAAGSSRIGVSQRRTGGRSSTI
jgi:PadR family transcriptional regulator PadR